MNELIEQIKTIIPVLQAGKQLICEEKIISFENAAETLLHSIDHIVEEGRNLRLGIVGEVKAGKSSFLNAMLFDGEDILPKAPTPMTAALTRIGYSENPSAKIHFYSENDWRTIENNNRAYHMALNELYEKYRQTQERKQSSISTESKRTSISSSSFHQESRITLAQFERDNVERIPAEYRACKEVYDMTMQRLPDFMSYLGKVVPIEGDENDIKSYLQQLNEYVGAEGKYTSIVKYTEIQINNPMLEGVEIIDTPGLNDPILSRSRTTREFLIECDAVFLMSYCGQFLGADDMGFIVSSLPNEGIKKAVLIGSKFDSAILQYPAKDATFRSAYLGTKRSCENQARVNLDECQATPSNYALIEQIKASLPPVCVSSIAYSAALQIKSSGQPTGEAEIFMINNMKRRFRDFREEYSILMGLSNIPDVKERVFAETREEKDRLIRERINGIYDSQRAKFSGLLEEILVQAKTNQADLKKYDRDELRNRLENSTQSLDKARVIVKSLFDNAAVDTKWKIQELSAIMRKEINNHEFIEVHHESHTKHHKKQTGHWFWKSTQHWDEIIQTHSADVQDVEKNLRDYRNRCLELVINHFKSMLKIEELKNNVKSVVMDAFNMADRNFDEASILMPLETALAGITLPSIELDMNKYHNQLDRMLSGIVSNGTVQNDKIPQLKRVQDHILEQISDDVIAMIHDKGDEIAASLEKHGANFIDDIEDQLHENIAKIEEMIAEKEENLIRYEEFIESIVQAKKMLRKVG